METVTFTSCIEADPRPTCVIDLDSTARDHPNIYYRNTALQAQSHLVHEVLAPTVIEGLCDWALDSEHRGRVAGTSIYAYTIEKRWRVIQWLPPEQQSEKVQNGLERSESSGKHSVSSQEGSPHSHRPADPLTLNRKLKDALAHRDDATGRLSNLLKMMEMVTVGMFEYNKEGVLVYGNDAFHTLSGVPKGDQTPMAWAECVFEEDRDWLTDYWTRLTQGEACTFEMRWINPDPDGEPVWVTAACVPTTDDAGSVTTVSGCISDITAQKRSHSDAVKRAEALERAHASETRFSNFIKHSNVAFYTFGRDSKMKYCNREWFEISGHPVVPLEEIEWANFMNAENLAIVQSYWDHMIATTQPTKFQFDLTRYWNDGNGHEMRASVLSCSYPEVGEDGSVVAVAGTLTDVTHLKWAEKLQKQRTDEAVEAKRQHEAFIDMTCHEIRNPLGAVVHCADLVRSSLTDMRTLITSASTPSPELEAFGEQYEAALESVNIIISCCAHQRRIVDDILTLSKLDSKLLNIAPSLTELDSMLCELEKMFEADARKSDVTLRLLKDLGDVHWAMIDTGRLMQVLINLITNAVKFTQKEARRIVTITVGVSRKVPLEQDLDVEFVPAGIARERYRPGTEGGEEVYLHFTVNDTGCGFDDEQKGRIFERFSQASPRTHSTYGGSGLGLFISREMIELQGGEIGVNSQPGHGATFAFYITARTAAAPVPNLPRRASGAPPLLRHRTPEKDKFCILVVEDNAVNQKVLRMQLKRLGHEVYVVSHGGEALEFLRTTSCWKGNEKSEIHLNVVLMDVEMPVMNGLECTKRIRAAENEGVIEGRLPIIAVSANAREGQVQLAKEVGVDDAISKPFRVADLMPMIERLVLS